jgi:hypothetical protein
MSSFFLLNNLHFALELLGALAFVIVAWLAVDACVVRCSGSTLSRAAGFIFLAAYQIIHALALSSDLALLSAHIALIAGVTALVVNLVSEAPVARPEFRAVIVLPAFAALAVPATLLAVIGLMLASALSFRQYLREQKVAIVPLAVAFLFLALGESLTLLHRGDPLQMLWIIGHLFELAGFLSLGWWVWGYLERRVREEMLIIFTAATLAMAIVVSLTFASILAGRIEAQAREGLIADTRVLEYAIERLREEALAKVRFVARDEALERALSSNNFAALEDAAETHRERERLDFLALVRADGEVLLRANAPTERGENLSDASPVSEALEGGAAAAIAGGGVDGFAIRAAAPIISLGENRAVLGAVLGGFALDSALVDGIKRISGLDLSIYESDARVATTLGERASDVRSAGVVETNEAVLTNVLSRGESLTLRTEILSRAYLASYLPLRDTRGTIVGMLSSAVSEQDLRERAQATNRITLIVVIVLMLILALPLYLVTKRIAREADVA